MTQRPRPIGVIKDFLPTLHLPPQQASGGDEEEGIDGVGPTGRIGKRLIRGEVLAENRRSCVTDSVDDCCHHISNRQDGDNGEQSEGGDLREFPRLAPFDTLLQWHANEPMRSTHTRRAPPVYLPESTGSVSRRYRWCGLSWAVAAPMTGVPLSAVGCLFAVFLVLALIFAGVGFVIHVLWIVAAVFFVFWLAGFAFGKGRRRAGR